MVGQIKKSLWLLAFLFLTACGEQGDPKPFTPDTKKWTEEGMIDLEEARTVACRDVKVRFEGDFLTAENFRGIFNCANYDRSLEPLRPLVTNEQFPAFVKNLNLILGSENTQGLRETLADWLEADVPGGTSKIDRLLPALSKIIKNPSFQEGLPVLDRLVQAGSDVWPKLLPSLANIVYHPRHEDTFEHLVVLFGNQITETKVEERDYAKAVKDFARFVKTNLDGKTVAERTLALLDSAKKVQVPGMSLAEYLERMNAKGIFASMYQESGALRGEVLNPKLNSEPEPDEIEEGLDLTPAERADRAYKKLFARGTNGETPPIVQLVGMLSEFHDPHPDFFPAFARWFSANGEKLNKGLFEYVARGMLRSNLGAEMNVAGYLSEYAMARGFETRQVTGPELAAFLGEAFAAGDFPAWLNGRLFAANTKMFGERNAGLLRGSSVGAEFAELYRIPAVAEYGATRIPAGRTLPLSTAITRFGNTHRSDEKLKPVFHGEEGLLEDHLIERWVLAMKASLGDSIVLNYGMELVQSLMNDFANNFGAKNVSIAQWYYASTYTNPDSTEALIGYAVRELDLLPVYYKHREYLRTTFADEAFPDAKDRAAFRILVDQVPNIWLYIKSGMSRSGNDLSRLLSARDKGTLINNFVNILITAYREGLVAEGVRIISEYQRQFPEIVEDVVPEDTLEWNRKMEDGVTALHYVLRALFRPEVGNDYETSTLQRLLKPLRELAAGANRAHTEKFLLVSADELIKTPDEKINDFFRDASKEGGGTDDEVVARRETLKSVSDLLKRPDFPVVLHQLSGFFQENAVKPALDYLANVIDDGSLQKVLLFLRRILGFRE